ncbi:putative transmembrane protein [Spiroplasma phoeniceum P40]|uniref:Transmembrane protein n=1 Tax=Spiroplasma phoeniceum P40 TaxID=1276259 RepID=A0A345DRT4_9MOLU|nr:putative transmembrane protein [Spiroplasma phoeniceum P40]
MGILFVPLMLYIIPEQGPYGNLAAPINATFYVTVQEIMATFVMFIFINQKNFY